MKEKITLLSIFLFFTFLKFASAAHFIVGYVPNAADGTSANGLVVTLWNPLNGLSDNLTDIVGSTGNSGTSNVYLIDCELLNAPCEVGDEIRVQISNSGNNYLSNYVNRTITGAGFDLMSNISVNSPPSFLNVTIEDDVSSPQQEIDLTPFGTKNVSCYGVVRDYDGENTLSNLTSQFFNTISSSYGDADDNNYHYTNSSRFLNTTYGSSSEIYYSCSYPVQYFAESGNWNCTLSVQDDYNLTILTSNTTNVNSLLAISVDTEIEFIAFADEVSEEETISVTNAGNLMINLSLSGYGETIGDNNSMSCSSGQNISVGYTKYNLTSPNPGDLTLPQFESLYRNLSSQSIVNLLNLDRRENDTSSGIDDTNDTYWRLYVPATAEGHCEGNIIFGAVQGSAS